MAQNNIKSILIHALITVSLLVSIIYRGGWSEGQVVFRWIALFTAMTLYGVLGFVFLKPTEKYSVLSVSFLVLALLALFGYCYYLGGGEAYLYFIEANLVGAMLVMEAFPSSFENLLWIAAIIPSLLMYAGVLIKQMKITRDKVKKDIYVKETESRDKFTKKKMILVATIIGVALLVYVFIPINEPGEKMYNALMNENYQGVYEVLRDSPDVDLEDIGTSTETGFSLHDSRALGIALSTGKEEESTVKLLIDSGADINSVGDTGKTYLMFSENKGVLLEAGAKVDCRDDVGNTVLDYSIIDGNMEEIRLLISYGAKPDKQTMQMAIESSFDYTVALEILKVMERNNSETGISHGLAYAIKGEDSKLRGEIKSKRIPKEEKKYVCLYAAMNCDVTTLRKLHEAGYDFTKPDDVGITPVHLAAEYNGLKELEFLGGLKGTINSKDDDYDSPIMKALIGGKKDNVEFFLERGTKFPDTYDAWSEVGALGNGDSLNILLSYDGTPNKDDVYMGYSMAARRRDGGKMFDLFLEKVPYPLEIDGVTLLSQIAASDEASTLKLIKLGGTVNIDAIANAISEGFYDLATKLIEEVDSVNPPKKNAYSVPLIAAVKCGNYELVKLLLEKGADVNYMSEGYGECKMAATHMAAISPSADILKLIFSGDADMSLKNGEGKTPYQCAKSLNYKENAKLLEGGLDG